jgi:hypothetical protein
VRLEYQIVPSHDWSHVPLGRAVIREVGNEAIAELQFSQGAAAVDWYEAIRFDFENPPALQQYSYGFSIKDGGARPGEFRGQRVRFLQPLASGQPGVEVFELSPVLKGAGVGVRTLAVKRRDDGLSAAQRAAMERIRDGGGTGPSWRGSASGSYSADWTTRCAARPGAES